MIAYNIEGIKENAIQPSHLLGGFISAHCVYFLNIVLKSMWLENNILKSYLVEYVFAFFGTLRNDFPLKISET